MEVDLIKALMSNGGSFILYLLLASGPLFSIAIIYMAYRGVKFFGSELLSALKNIANQTELLGKMFELTKLEIREVRQDVDEVKEITADTNRRLGDIERRGGRT